jgi:trehalose 6-phosphate synthase
LVAHYLAADIALVTPVKDGLNLVAKEYVISNCRDIGVLLLSPFAGAASQLQDALLANPYDPREMASKIIFGLKMPIAEKKQRLAALNKIVKEQDIFWWWRQFWQNWLPQMVLSKTVASRNVRPEVLCHEPLDSIAGRNAGILGR